MAIQTDDLQTLPALCAFDGAPLRCVSPDLSPTYRVSYEIRPGDIDSFVRICVEIPGHGRRTDLDGLPLCSEHDAAVAVAARLLDMPEQPVFATGGAPGAAWQGGHPAGAGAAPGPGLLLAGGAQPRTDMVTVGGAGGGAGDLPHGGAHPVGPQAARPETGWTEEVGGGGPVGSDLPGPLPVPLPPSGLALLAILLSLALLAGLRRRAA